MAKAKQNKAGSAAVSQDVDMDMTPMIDCVFLLMIFFVLVIDLSQKDLEDLILPKAIYAVPDEKPPELRPIINITQDGKIVYRRNPVYDPAVDGPDNFLRAREQMIEIKNELPPSEFNTTKIPGKTIVDTPVLIRADKWTEWHYVGKFMTECSKPELAFWKLELAMSEEDKEEVFRKGGN
jgi:biopolymer transport protein ExbD